MKILNIAICIVFIIGYVFSYEINILKENYDIKRLYGQVEQNDRRISPVALAAFGASCVTLPTCAMGGLAFMLVYCLCCYQLNFNIKQNYFSKVKRTSNKK
ncbi:hypothetical protein H8356DRAFT_1334246 [Neocallimastix lanati (nom. inval.)]|nr:hypothetical protein H8356DRAFT_1334246 [Neocallimastix sp. JGI-2020a]